MEQNKYLEYLAELYPTIEKASTEIINLQSIINLPKGTEHFLSDIHGEYEAFSHVLRNGSGAVRKKIDDVFGHTLGTAEKRSVATLIYYPREKLEQLRQSGEDMQNWYRVTLYRLIELCRVVSSKYTRSKVRKALPPDYAYVIEELITEKPELSDKEAYYEAIIQTILDIGRAEPFIIAMAELIQRLVVDHLHIIGDIFDRGPLPHQIMDCLMDYHSLDIQWGNHDVLWMGAAAGQQACIATKGSLYKVYNGNLLYHGCVPMNEDGSFMEVPVYGQTYHGKALYDVLEQYVRKAFFSMEEEEKERGRNILWFLWSAPGSPLYGRSKMATFERYLIAEKETHQELKNAYYQLLEKKETAEKILKEFGLEGEEARIINGHVPVHQKEGESPVKCEGKLLIIDGGFSRAYHRETGIAGYTLIYNSYGMSLAAHEPFETTEIAIQEEKDIVSHQIAVNYSHKRQTVGDTDNGKQLLKKIGELKELIGAYRSGTIKERGN